MSIPKLTAKKFNRLLKKVVKRRWDYKDYIKTPEKWWEVYNLCVMSGLIRDERFTGIEDLEGIEQETNHRRRSCRQVVLHHMFPGCSEYYMSQGKRQSLTYRSNRMRENLKSFASNEKDRLSSTRYSRGYYSSPMAPSLNISSVWTVSIEGNTCGIVFAPTTPAAEQKAKMFVLPMVRHVLNIGDKDPDVDITHVSHTTPETSMADFIQVSTKVSETYKTSNEDLEKRIEKLKQQIERNNLIISSVRDNMMVELEVNQ